VWHCVPQALLHKQVARPRLGSGRVHKGKKVGTSSGSDSDAQADNELKTAHLHPHPPFYGFPGLRTYPRRTRVRRMTATRRTATLVPPALRAESRYYFARPRWTCVSAVPWSTCTVRSSSITTAARFGTPTRNRTRTCIFFLKRVEKQRQ
jgi:hypothetical protein